MLLFESITWMYRSFIKQPRLPQHGSLGLGYTYIIERAMFAAASTTITSIEVKAFRQHNEALVVIIIMYTFNPVVHP